MDYPVTEEALTVRVTETHDGVAPSWMASARGVTCGSEFSADDAVTALIEQLLETGALTEDEVADVVVGG